MSVFHILSWIIKKISCQVEKNELKNLKLLLNSVGTNVLIESPYEIIHPKNISIGNDFHTSRYVKLSTIENYENELFSPKLTIGNNVFINSYSHIACASAVSIGDNVLIAGKVYISDHSHGCSDLCSLKHTPMSRKLTTRPVVIKDNVWIGESVSILMGVTIGKNCIIGANSLVNKSFPPNSVIAGVPARLIKSIVC